MNLKTIINILPFVGLLVMVLWGFLGNAWSVSWIASFVGVMLITLFNSLNYRSLAAIDENQEMRATLKARANLLFINTVIMLVSVILSLIVLPYCAIIGIVIISITYVLPIFKK